MAVEKDFKPHLFEYRHDGAVWGFEILATSQAVVGELDSTQALTYTAEYWPYGEVQTETGSYNSNWGFVGLLGYFKDLASLLYVRARHYLPGKGRWVTVDPLWPRQLPYNYVLANPIVLTDPTGRNVACIGCGLCLGATALALLLSCLGSENILDCMKCKLMTNPAVAAALLVCGVVCIACVGIALINWLRAITTGGLAGSGALAGASGGNDPCRPGEPPRSEPPQPPGGFNKCLRPCMVLFLGIDCRDLIGSGQDFSRCVRRARDFCTTWCRCRFPGGGGGGPGRGIVEDLLEEAA